MSKFKVILWDIDGTLLDFHPAERHAIQKCFREFGLGECTDEMVQEYSGINKRYWLALELGKITKEQVLVGRFRELFANHGIDEELATKVNAKYQMYLGDEVFFFPGVMDMIQDFKEQGLVQCAVTNGTKVAQVRKLSKSGLDQLLDFIFISEDVGYEKPAPEFFQKVFAKIGEYQPDEVLIVGDSLTSDMKGGKGAGIRTCWFNPKGVAKSFQIDTDYEIQQIVQVRDIIKD